MAIISDYKCLECGFIKYSESEEDFNNRIYENSKEIKMKIVKKTVVKDEKCKWMLDKLNSKNSEEVKTILYWELDKLVARGATGIGVASESDTLTESTIREDDKKNSMAEMVVFASFMKDEDCNKEISVQWNWE